MPLQDAIDAISDDPVPSEWEEQRRREYMHQSSSRRF
jgi:hypothetical protein